MGADGCQRAEGLASVGKSGGIRGKRSRCKECVFPLKGSGESGNGQGSVSDPFPDCSGASMTVGSRTVCVGAGWITGKTTGPVTRKPATVIDAPLQGMNLADGASAPSNARIPERLPSLELLRRGDHRRKPLPTAAGTRISGRDVSSNRNNPSHFDLTHEHRHPVWLWFRLAPTL